MFIFQPKGMRYDPQYLYANDWIGTFLVLKGMRNLELEAFTQRYLQWIQTRHLSSS